ncbi:MAG TPA: NADPH-dependent F420 reductase [Actinomycetota bacterium]|nr:NADPH-dependent F420 reductase [Actinomycetota bacterium]
MDVAVIGGTGEEGFGLTLRLARAGQHAIIGSRSQEKGATTAEKARGILGADGRVDGTTNQAAAEAGEIVFVTVPYAGQADIYRAIKDHVAAGKIVVDCTSPLATAVGGRAWQVVHPWHGSAAEQAKAILDPGVRMVAAFHTIAGGALQDLEHPIESDVLVCGRDREAKGLVGGVIDQIPDLRWVDAGDLSMARIVETLTAVLVSVNRNYRIHDSGFRMTGRDSWGPRPER